MPSLNFHMSKAEWDRLIEFIFSKGCYIACEPWRRSTPEILYLKDIEEINKHYENLDFPWFILHDDYLECPLFQYDYKVEDQTFYSMSQRLGGPSISLYYLKVANAGIILHYPSYFYDKVEYTAYRPPEVFFKIYKEIINYIKRNTTIIKCVVNGITSRHYCGKEYLSMVIEGKLQVRDTLKESIIKHFNSSSNI